MDATFSTGCGLVASTRGYIPPPRRGEELRRRFPIRRHGLPQRGFTAEIAKHAERFPFTAAARGVRLQLSPY